MKACWGWLAILGLAACQNTVPVKETPVAPVQTPIAVPVSDEGGHFAASRDVRRFVDAEVRGGAFTRQELDNFFAGVAYQPGILNAMDKPGTSQPWYVFRTNNIGGKRLSNGDQFWVSNESVLLAVSQHYGVPVELIVAILGIETNYGRNMGSYRVADALSTLAFNYPRRAGYFQHELALFLQLAHEERRNPFTFNGSYAGAMGMPQFMPSSYRQWAVDWDGDGQRDIWNNAGDAAASVANYMKQHGWQTGRLMAVPVALTPTPRLNEIMAANTELKYTAGQLRRMGVVIPASVDDNEKGVLFQLENAPGQYEYWLGLNNYYTVWHYNHSRLYVSAVRELANSLHGGNGRL